ncbi:nucleotide exchange factor GrpE [Streptosporangium sp. NPDC048865]|uniref:nucleotide exchange factor GrpE n=1 Tax=Streptosporangium sp. NPDC048865 TaxID=3155766 RepID=UPI00342DFDA2
MSETPGHGGPHVPRRDDDPRGGYAPPGREPDGRDHAQGGDDGRYAAQGPQGTEDRPGDQHGDRQGDRQGDRSGDREEARDRWPDGLEGQAGVPDASEGLRDRVQELQDLVAELQDRRMRALADLDNLRKRAARDAERTRWEERARAAGEWLPVLDNLDRALEHAETDPGSIVDGMRAIRDQAQEVLSRLGYPRRDDTGTVFDPARHEAVGVLSQEGVPDGTVLRVVLPGYGDGERQLRPALVVVAKGA